MRENEFTIEDAIEIQRDHLSRWKSILIPEAYEALEEYALRNNHKAESGYDICRGHQLDNYIGNYMLGHRF
jgi:hypothetical protein